MLIKKSLDLYEKLTLLANGAKFDVSCASSGVYRRNSGSNIGRTSRSGICHTFTSDGRCISLLKILLTNLCSKDCAYCINRRTNDIKRTLLYPEELAQLTFEFYRRNYIEGLFLSSAVLGSSEKTMEMMIKTVILLRKKYGFNGYIHLKLLPDLSEQTILEAIKWADRVSINLELPKKSSLEYLAPEKNYATLLNTMSLVKKFIEESKEKGDYFYSRGGQSTQLIIGATPDSDKEILSLAERLYKTYKLKRVYYSAYVPLNEDPRLPAFKNPPLLREHRLYQADWLIRFYHFKVEELFPEDSPYLQERIDPKLAWALNNLHLFPVEITSASYKCLLRVPGIGPISAKRIIQARRNATLDFITLKKLGVSVNRAKYFITIKGKYLENIKTLDHKSYLKKIFLKSQGEQILLYEDSCLFQ